ncbi:MAG: hypothetical protein P0S94_04355, partial [Simkaniaceae bacterium]|nr:hypothetical protein [Simkaniaceae bacterium]
MSRMSPIALVCAHSPIMQQFFDATLSDGFDMIGVSGIEDLIDRLSFTGVDLIIVDEKAAQGDLIDAIKKIRVACVAPILIITGSLKKSHHRQLLTAGATDFIHEPLDVDEVKQCIEQAMKKKVMKNKVTGLVSQIPRIRKKLDQVVANYVSEDRTSALAQGSLKSSTSLGSILIEVDTVEQWRFVDTHLPKNIESVVPMGQERRLLLMRNISQADLQEHVKRIRDATKVRIGW